MSGDSDDRVANGTLLGPDMLGGGGGSELGLRDDNNEREREGRELLDSLRSPNLELENAEVGAGVGLDDENDEPGVGTVMPGDPMESLGTGPGGWGASMGGGTARPTGVVGAVEQGGGSRRAAIYDDEVYEDGDAPQYANAMHTTPAPGPPRRPSRSGDGDRDGPSVQPERKLRI